MEKLDGNNCSASLKARVVTLIGGAHLQWMSALLDAHLFFFLLSLKAIKCCRMSAEAEQSAVLFA